MTCRWREPPAETAERIRGLKGRYNKSVSPFRAVGSGHRGPVAYATGSWFAGPSGLFAAGSVRGARVAGLSESSGARVTDTLGVICPIHLLMTRVSATSEKSPTVQRSSTLIPSPSRQRAGVRSAADGPACARGSTPNATVHSEDTWRLRSHFYRISSPDERGHPQSLLTPAPP